jgi:protease I
LRLREEGITTLFVGPGRKKDYGSKEGYPAPEEMSIARARPNAFAGVIIPGGYAPDLLRRDKRILSFVRKMDRAGKVVAAICHGGWVLASAGILRGKRATCFSAIRDDIVNAGAEYLDREAVVDGNLVTSRTPDDLPAFCREIIALLKV